MPTTMVDKNEELVTEIFNPSDMIVVHLHLGLLVI